MTGIRRLIIGALSAFVIAFAAAACGGDSGTVADTGSSTAAESPQKPEAREQTEGEGEAAGPDDKSGEAEAPQESSPEAEPDQEGEQEGEQEQSEPPAAEQEAPPQAQSKPKKGIRGFGAEASAAEREAASKLVGDFMQGREDQEWKVVCASLSKSLIAPLERLAQKNPQLKGKGCVTLLTIAAKQSTATDDFQNSLSGPIDSLRVKGKRGFAIYSDSSGDEFAQSVVREGGNWKIGAFEARELS